MIKEGSFRYPMRCQVICYLPECKIQVKTEGNRLSVHVSTDAVMRETDDPALHKEIRLSAIMEDESPDGRVLLAAYRKRIRQCYPFMLLGTGMEVRVN